MRIEQIRIEREASGVRLSARLDGFELWYRFAPGTPLVESADPFLAAALLPAMRAGSDIQIDELPVSARLLAGTARIQQVFHRWDPAFRRIEVRARAAPAAPARAGRVAFFSGGVDGGYTLLAHEQEIDQLLFVRGIDMQLDNRALFDEVDARNRRTAAAFGKVLAVVETNIRAFCHPRGVPWGTMYCGAGLASIALALGVSHCWIASSQSYADLSPWGTHPLLDPLWSTETTTFECDGAEAERSDKLARVVQSPVLLESLRVCWQDAGYNCNRCEKCLRTRIGLRLLGARTPSLLPLDDVGELSGLRAHSAADVGFLRDNLALAERVGDLAVARVLRRAVRDFELRRALDVLDRHLAGGALRRLMRRSVRGHVSAQRGLR